MTTIAVAIVGRAIILEREPLALIIQVSENRISMGIILFSITPHLVIALPTLR